MIEGHRDAEAGEVDKGEWTPWLEKKAEKKERLGIRKAEIVQEKREQVRETDVENDNNE